MFSFWFSFSFRLRPRGRSTGAAQENYQLSIINSQFALQRYDIENRKVSSISITHWYSKRKKFWGWFRCFSISDFSFLSNGWNVRREVLLYIYSNYLYLSFLRFTYTSPQKTDIWNIDTLCLMSQDANALKMSII